MCMLATFGGHCTMPVPCPPYPTFFCYRKTYLVQNRLCQLITMLSKLHDGYTRSLVVKGLTCKRGCYIVVACTLLLNKWMLLRTKNCVQYQKLIPYKGNGSVSMPICVNRRETAQPVPPRPFYSQLRQLPCTRHGMTIPTHLLLSHLLLLAQNLSSSKQMLSKLHDG